MSSFYLEHMPMLTVSMMLIKLWDIITDGAKSSERIVRAVGESEKERGRKERKGDRIL